MDLKQQYRLFGISENVYEYGRQILDSLQERFMQIDQIAEYNQLKVIRAMQAANVSFGESLCRCV